MMLMILSMFGRIDAVNIVRSNVCMYVCVCVGLYLCCASVGKCTSVHFTINDRGECGCVGM